MGNTTSYVAWWDAAASVGHVVRPPPRRLRARARA
jgi:hypothetical protein